MTATERVPDLGRIPPPETKHPFDGTGRFCHCGRAAVNPIHRMDPYSSTAPLAWAAQFNGRAPLVAPHPPGRTDGRVPGVYRDMVGNRGERPWRAKIGNRHLGYFASREEAVQARLQAEQERRAA